MGSVWGPSFYTQKRRNIFLFFCVFFLDTRGFLYVSSVRVPDDSDSKSGVIKQRQNCLESQRVEGQELPLLTLAPCVGSQGVNAIKQVRWPEKGQSALAYLVKISQKLCVTTCATKNIYKYNISVGLEYLSQTAENGNHPKESQKQWKNAGWTQESSFLVAPLSRGCFRTRPGIDNRSPERRAFVVPPWRIQTDRSVRFMMTLTDSDSGGGNHHYGETPPEKRIGKSHFEVILLMVSACEHVDHMTPSLVYTQEMPTSSWCVASHKNKWISPMK